MSTEKEAGAAPPFENLPPRLDLIAPADLDGAQRAVYDAITGGPRASQAGTVPITDSDGRLLGPFAVMLLTPAVGDAMQQVGAKIRFAAALTARERELAILTVAGQLRSDFERLAHEPAARSAGLTQAQVNAALAGRVPDGLTDTEALVGRLARVMTAERTLPDPDYEAGVRVLGRERLADLTWLVGYYCALALSLAVFRPFLPHAVATAYQAGATARLGVLAGRRPAGRAGERPVSHLGPARRYRCWSLPSILTASATRAAASSGVAAYPANARCSPAARR